MLVILQTVLLVLWYAVPQMAAVPWPIIFIPLLYMVGILALSMVA